MKKCLFAAILLLSGCVSQVQPEESIVPEKITEPEVNQEEMIYLWEEANMPTVTAYSENNGSYQDDPDFRPHMTAYWPEEGTPIKGVVIVCSGGAFQVRSNENEGNPAAEALSERGYLAYVLNYRVRPYTMEEGSLDLARAVRYVKSQADEIGFDEEKVAVMGFSAGGILCGDMLLHFDEFVDGSVLDPDYQADELDKINADVRAVGMIYSFYGRLSVASTDIESFRAADLPPAYFVYGTEDPFFEDFMACADALLQAGVEVEEVVLEGWAHGFGAQGDWIDGFDAWLMELGFE